MSEASFCWWCGTKLAEEFAVVRDRRVHKICFSAAVEFFREVTAQPKEPCPLGLAEDRPINTTEETR